MSQTVPISFTCKACGTKLTWSNDAIDSTVISCKKCGKVFGAYADLRHTAVDALKSKVDSTLKDIFKRR